jgi:hypothetical protein
MRSASSDVGSCCWSFSSAKYGGLHGLVVPFALVIFSNLMEPKGVPTLHPQTEKPGILRKLTGVALARVDFSQRHSLGPLSQKL